MGTVCKSYDFPFSEILFERCHLNNVREVCFRFFFLSFIVQNAPLYTCTQNMNSVIIRLVLFLLLAFIWKTTKFQSQTEEPLDWIFEDQQQNQFSISISVLLTEFDFSCIVVTISNRVFIRIILTLSKSSILCCHFLRNSNKMYRNTLDVFYRIFLWIAFLPSPCSFKPKTLLSAYIVDAINGRKVR